MEVNVGMLLYDLNVLSRSELYSLEKISLFLYENITEDGLSLQSVYELIEQLKGIDEEVNNLLVEHEKRVYEEGYSDGFSDGVDSITFNS